MAELNYCKPLKQHYNNVNKSLFENINPVEFPEDIWNEIKLFKPEFPLI